MNPTCAANVVSLICHSVFRECKQVQDKVNGIPFWLPSLLCRSECEQHWETWNTCLDNLEQDQKAKVHFDKQMLNLVFTFVPRFLRDQIREEDIYGPFRLLECDSPGTTNALSLFDEDYWTATFWGQFPANSGNIFEIAVAKTNYNSQISWLFPPNMETTFLYPEVSSKYTLPDGSTTDVACFVPGEAKETPKIECPFPFVNPVAKDHLESCIQPCPVQAYSKEEYTLMWVISNGVGLIGFLLNLFMACTMMIGGQHHISKQPHSLKFCVFAGCLFGLVGTIPSLALKYDLPCECETEEW
jgi:hypothetical protein